MCCNRSVVISWPSRDAVGIFWKPPFHPNHRARNPQIMIEATLALGAAKPQENSYRIFYSLKYIPYTHSTCRIYSLLVPGILESRMSQETASVLGNSYRIFYSLKYIPYTRGYVGSISISAERILK